MAPMQVCRATVGVDAIIAMPTDAMCTHRVPRCCVHRHPPSRAIDTSIISAIVAYLPATRPPCRLLPRGLLVGAVPTPDLQRALASRWCCMKGKWGVTLRCCYHLLSCVRLCWPASTHWRPRCRCCQSSLCVPASTHVRPQHHHDACLHAVTVVRGGGSGW